MVSVFCLRMFLFVYKMFYFCGFVRQNVRQMVQNWRDGEENGKNIGLLRRKVQIKTEKNASIKWNPIL